MQFKVPQFIDMEDKVFGNLSFKQFVYLVGAAGFSYIAIKLLPTIIAFVIVPALVGLGLALAFVKINEKPFIHALESFIRYYSKSRLYLWKKQEPKASVVNKELPPKTIRDSMTESKLKTLSWSLDVIDSQKK